MSSMRSPICRFCRRAPDRSPRPAAGNQASTSGYLNRTAGALQTSLLVAPDRITGAMSAIGPKQTSATALHMSAFGGKADIALGSSPLGFDPREETETWHPRSVVRGHRGWPRLNCVDSETHAITPLMFG